MNDSSLETADLNAPEGSNEASAPAAETPAAVAPVTANDAAVDAAAAATNLAPAEGDAAPAEPAAATAKATPEMSPAECAAKLKALFPAIFGGGVFKPLKLRIQADIQERAPAQFSKAQLSSFLRRHTGNTGYLIALGKATHRFDLDGQAVAELSEEHRLAAREELARRRGLQQERLAAEQAERDLAQTQARNRAGLLHDFERTTLTLPNFCVLKGVTEAELPGLLEIARAERAAQPVREARPANAGPRGPGRGRPEGRGDGRGETRGAGRPAARGDGRGEGREQRGPRGRAPGNR